MINTSTIFPCVSVCVSWLGKKLGSGGNTADSKEKKLDPNLNWRSIDIVSLDFQGETSGRKQKSERLNNMQKSGTVEEMKVMK
jgi:hypothetical protein